MKCVNCKAEIPPNSRFCLVCGAAQPQSNFGPTRVVTPHQTETDVADGESQAEKFSWARREAIINAQVDSDIDFEARDRYDIGGRSFGCLSVPFFVFIGLLMLIPGIPLLALVGIPAALILTPLTWVNVGDLQEKIRSSSWLKRFPGFKRGTRGALTAAVFLYLTVGSIVSILILIAQSHPH